MALEASGNLSLGTNLFGATRCIRYEILGSYGSYSLSQAITASASGFTKMTDFYGYTHDPDPILRAFNKSALFYDSDLCLTTTTSTGYYLGRIWSSQSLVGGTGQTLYEGERATNGGNTLTGAKVFRVSNLLLGFDKIVTNSSSVVTSWIQCSP